MSDENDSDQSRPSNWMISRFVVELDDHTSLTFRRRTMSDDRQIASWLDDDIAPETFVQNFLELVVDERDRAKLQGAIDSLGLLTVALAFGTHPRCELAETLSHHDSTLDGFKSAIREQMVEHHKRLSELFREASSEMIGIEKFTLNPLSFDWKSLVQDSAMFGTVGFHIDQILDPMSIFRGSVDSIANLAGGSDAVRDALKAIQPDTSTIAFNLGQSAADLMGSLFPTPDVWSTLNAASGVQDVLDAIPSFNDQFRKMLDKWEADEKSVEELRAAEHHEAVDVLWMTGLLERLRTLQAEDGQQSISESLKRLVASDEFLSILMPLFNGTTKLALREDIILDGILLHNESRYTSSVPTLLPQVEGMFLELLLVVNAAWMDGLQPRETGNYSHQLDNWKKKRNVYRKFDSEGRYVSSDFTTKVIQRLIRRRDLILHGQITDYATIDESTRVVLSVATMMRHLHEFETSEWVWDKDEEEYR